MTGWHVIRGGPSSGKTLLASLFARSYSRVLWLSSEGDEDYLWAQIGFFPTFRVPVEGASQAIAVLARLQDAVDLAVIDSVTALRGNLRVQRRRFVPEVPILVTVQDRGPWSVEVGGVVGRYQLRLFRQLPVLYSRIDSHCWLIWWDGPVIRPLVAGDKVWLPGEEIYECDDDARR